MLAATPARIAALITDLSPLQLHAAPTPGEWSINEILAHLRACADVWGNCMAEMIIQDHPTLRAINPRMWIKRTDYADQTFHASLQAFATQRTDLLATLELLTPDDWARSATVKGAGKPLERTVRFYAEWLAVHERSHLKLIEPMVQMIHTAP
jgi:uncharacterized damage-inducible protein DinB